MFTGRFVGFVHGRGERWPVIVSLVARYQWGRWCWVCVELAWVVAAGAADDYQRGRRGSAPGSFKMLARPSCHQSAKWVIVLGGYPTGNSRSGKSIPANLKSHCHWACVQSAEDQLVDSASPGTVLLLVIVVVWGVLAALAILHEKSRPANEDQSQVAQQAVHPPVSRSGDAEKVQPTSQRDTHDAQRYLNAVRKTSCYGWLRDVHEFVTGAAILACGVLWVVLLTVADNTPARIYSSIVCGVLIVGLVIERGLFTLLVDAADVLVDMGQHKRASAVEGAETPTSQRE
jgi:hypothetical protein